MSNIKKEDLGKNGTWDNSWNDVISGFSLVNNFNSEQEKLLDKLINYLNSEYPDTFKKK